MKYIVINKVYNAHGLCYYTNNNFKLKLATFKQVKHDHSFLFNKDQLDKFIKKMDHLFGTHWQKPSSPIQILSWHDYKKQYKHSHIANVKNVSHMSDAKSDAYINKVADLAYKVMANDDDSKEMQMNLQDPNYMADRIRVAFGIDVKFQTSRKANKLCDVIAFWQPKKKCPLIIVSDYLSQFGTRWALAHALGHIFLQWHWYKGYDLYSDYGARKLLKSQDDCLCMCTLQKKYKVTVM